MLFPRQFPENFFAHLQFCPSTKTSILNDYLYMIHKTDFFIIAADTIIVS